MNAISKLFSPSWTHYTPSWQEMSDVATLPRSFANGIKVDRLERIWSCIASVEQKGIRSAEDVTKDRTLMHAPGTYY